MGLLDRMSSAPVADTQTLRPVLLIDRDDETEDQAALPVPAPRADEMTRSEDLEVRRLNMGSSKKDDPFRAIRERVQTQLLRESNRHLKLDDREAVRSQIVIMLDEALAASGIQPARVDYMRILDSILYEVQGYGPVQPLLDDVLGGAISATGGTGILAAPNPCPGTGTAAANSVPFRDGSPSAQYTYTSASLPDQGAGSITQSPAGRSYPSADFTIAEDKICNTAFGGTQPLMWTQEFGTDSAGTVLGGQHLHFLWFTRSARTCVQFSGNQSINWYGIMYDPEPSGCNGQSEGMKLVGGSAGAFGPPMLEGQIIADSVKFSGNSATEVYYRPCPTQANCETGPGSHLVQ